MTIYTVFVCYENQEPSAIRSWKTREEAEAHREELIRGIEKNFQRTWKDSNGRLTVWTKDDVTHVEFKVWEVPTP